MKPVYAAVWRMNVLATIYGLEFAIRFGIGDVEAHKINVFGLRVSLGWGIDDLPAEVLVFAKKATLQFFGIILFLCII
tara:strand:+ start:1238 stop:1471 length:234 start_codon:yes stop_codon:yes gene_type:complete